MNFFGRKIILSLILIGFTQAGEAAEFNFQVVVHPTNSMTSIEQKHLADIFLKKRTIWPDNRSIEVVDLDITSGARREFSEEVLDRPISAVRMYWQQLLFSGRGVPPPEFESEDEVIEFVTSNEGAIGYISNRVDLKTLKVIAIR